MNSLSWLIYVADLVGSFKFLGFLGFFGCIVLAIFMPRKGMQAFSNEHIPFDGIRRTSVWIFFFICVLLTTIVPSERVIYMIAASEVGEQVINTPEAREMFDILRQRIMDELKVVAK